MPVQVQQVKEEDVSWVEILFPGDNLWWISGALGAVTAGALLILAIMVQMVFFRPHLLHLAAPPSLPAAPCDLCDRRLLTRR